MKKRWFLITIGLAIIIMVLSCYGIAISDREPPEIIIKKEIYYNEQITEDELLEEVEAIDEWEGDVSDSIVIEAVIVDKANGYVVVKYAARDSKNNIAKKSRVLVWENQEEKLP